MAHILKPFCEQAEGGPLGYSFFCPGCNESHPVWIRRIPGGVQGDVWDWNGSVEKPTFTPSVLGQWPIVERNAEGRYVTKGEGRCHSFIAEGVIDFLNDCTHQLRGKHPLPPHPGVTE